MELIMTYWFVSIPWAIVWIIITMAVAGSKGRSTGNAFLGGCLFGPFATIYFLMVADNNALEQRRQQEYTHKYAQWLAHQQQAHFQGQIQELKQQLGQSSPPPPPTEEPPQ